MSSGIRKVQQRLELKQENSWLKNAFRKAMNAAIEQSDNAAELTKALVIAVQKSGGAVLVTKGDIEALDANTKLRAETDEHGNTTYFVYVDDATTAVILENIADEEAVESE